MKRRSIVALILCLLMTVSLFAGCGSSSTPAADGADVTQNGSAEVEWPVRTVTVICATKAGSTSDQTIRAECEYLTELTGVNFVVKNEPTGNGTLAAQLLVDAKPDGYTLLAAGAATASLYYSGAMDINLNKEEFATLITYGLGSARKYGSVLCTMNDDAHPYSTLEELVDYCEAHPGEVRWGMQPSSGELKAMPLIDHFDMNVNILMAQTNELVPNMLGGYMDVAFLNPQTCTQYIENGQMKPLVMELVKDCEGDDPILAAIPTYKDLGIEECQYSSPMFVVGPAGMDEALVNKIKETLDTFKDHMWEDEYKAVMESSGSAYYVYTREELREIIDTADAVIEKYLNSRNAG